MILLDVNVLVDAHRRDAAHHDQVAGWVTELMTSGQTVLLADVAMAGFLRIVTSPRIFAPPTALPTAIGALDSFLEVPSCRLVGAGPRHWELLRGLLVAGDARGNLVPDAHLAAIALEQGAAIATRDRGFGRFPGIRTVEPVA